MSEHKFSKQAELDFMHNFRHDTEGDRWAKHEIESLRRQLASLKAENMELKNNITICSVRIKELIQQLDFRNLEVLFLRNELAAMEPNP